MAVFDLDDDLDGSASRAIAMTADLRLPGERPRKEAVGAQLLNERQN